MTAIIYINKIWWIKHLRNHDMYISQWLLFDRVSADFSPWPVLGWLDWCAEVPV